MHQPGCFVHPKLEHSGLITTLGEQVSYKLRSKVPVRWLALLFLASGLLMAQSQPASQTAPNQQNPNRQKPNQQKNDQDIPDAPSVGRPAPQLPTTSPSQISIPPRETQQPEDQSPPKATPSGIPKGADEFPFPEEAPQTQVQDSRPPLNIETVPEGGATKEHADAQEQLFRIVRDINQVIVPVMVQNDSGHVVDGLTSDDFAVYENGIKQQMNFFTSDPFALSAAVILDYSMPDSDVQKVNKTFSALQGSFSQYDEVAVYTYSHAVTKQTNFLGAGRKLSSAFNQLEYARGANNGPPTLDGPFGPQGPSVNSIPINPNAPLVAAAPPKPSHVLNDAILRAAVDLEKRNKSRRKVIFVISDGREYGSQASYRDVLRILLTNGIMVYGVGVGSSAIPVYNTLQKVHLPHMGYGDILPKYASATGGEIINEFSSQAMEDAYARIMGDARNQYTLGYVTRGMSTAYRQVEVRVNRPGLKIYTKDGYYPLPPARRQ